MPWPIPEPLFSPQDLLAMAQDPRSHEAFLPWGDAPVLLVDGSGEVLDGPGNAALAAWLAVLPCPAIAIGAEAGARETRGWFDACDVTLDGVDEVVPVVEAVRSRPLSAALFVQLLRRTEGLPLEAALAAESLAYATLQAGPEHRQWLASHRPATARHTDTGPAVLVERDGATLTAVLNRPSRGNAMSVEMRDALLDLLRAAAGERDIAELWLSGRGKHFSTGGDLDEFGTVPDPVTGHLVRALALPGRALAACGARVTAVLHGECIGSGIEFPAFADRLVARPDARFSLPELRFGLIPGAGGCVSLPRRIGRQRTAWMVLTGERIAAETALGWGLIDAVEAR